MTWPAASLLLLFSNCRSFLSNHLSPVFVTPSSFCSWDLPLPQGMLVLPLLMTWWAHIFYPFLDPLSRTRAPVRNRPFFPLMRFPPLLVLFVKMPVFSAAPTHHSYFLRPPLPRSVTLSTFFFLTPAERYPPPSCRGCSNSSFRSVCSRPPAAYPCSASTPPFVISPPPANFIFPSFLSCRIFSTAFSRLRCG